MDSFKDSVALWATIVGTLVTIFGVVQSRSWLLAVGVLSVVGSLGTLVYANKQREIVQSAALKVAGRSIDSLNAASLRRLLNRSLIIQQAENVAVIDGEDLSITWECTGYCRTDCATAIEFSIDADTNVPFDELDCFAYDLRHDPKERHRIRPILIGPDGISKKIAVPFLSSLSAEEPFHVLLKCTLPGCMKAGVDYYTTTLSFEQERIQRYTMRLVFMHDLPEWLRVYEWRTGRTVNLLKDLRPQAKSAGVSEYRDDAEEIPARSARIYVFSRSSALGGPTQMRQLARSRS
jgi:hypothetical protein